MKGHDSKEIVLAAERSTGSLLVRVGRLWALVGVAVVLGRPSLRLTGNGWRQLTSVDLSALEWVGLVVIVTMFVWGEGIQVLHRRWVPFVVRRIQSLNAESDRARLLFAPLHALALIGGPRSTVIRSWLGTGAILVAVFLVTITPNPWRAMVELGVGGALLVAFLSLIGRWIATGGPESTRNPLTAQEDASSREVPRQLPTQLPPP